MVSASFSCIFVGPKELSMLVFVCSLRLRSDLRRSGTLLIVISQSTVLASLASFRNEEANKPTN